MKITFNLNGNNTIVDADPAQTLLEILREDLQLTGTKKGCGKGECGACTVFLQNEIVNSCLLPLKQVENKNVVTIEGIKKTKYFAPIQKAFEDAGAVQCGFCIPGFIMATVNFLRNTGLNNKVEDKDIKEALSGNLCRCTGYVKIIDAVKICLNKKIKIPEELI